MRRIACSTPCSMPASRSSTRRSTTARARKRSAGRSATGATSSSSPRSAAAPSTQTSICAPARRPHDYSYANVRDGVLQSLRRLRTDHLDLVQFHLSPSREVMEADGGIDALRQLQQEGHVRFIGSSSTLPHLPDHIAMGVFDAFQVPYSLLDRSHEDAIASAADAGAGVIIRGGVARGQPGDGRGKAEVWAALGCCRPGRSARRRHPDAVRPALHAQPSVDEHDDRRHRRTSSTCAPTSRQWPAVRSRPMSSTKRPAGSAGSPTTREIPPT